MINHPQRKHLAGFTLIEILVTVSLTAIIMMGITSLFISFISTTGKSRLSQNIRENGTVAMQKMIVELRNAKSVDISSADCDGIKDLATLNFTSASELNSQLLASNNRILLDSGGTNYFLTSDSNQLRDLNFVCYDSQEARYIEISFTLASSTATDLSPTHSQLDFRSGVTLRN